MRLFRDHSGLIASVALLWHVMAMAVVSAALTCGTGSSSPSVAMAGQEGMSHGSMSHEGMAGHEGMVDCPMQKSQPVCPMHGNTGSHKCDCPTMGCSQTDTGFMALFGAVGILPADMSIGAPFVAGDAAPVLSASAVRLAPVPLAPPPRA